MAGEGRKPFTLEDLAKATGARKPDGRELKFKEKEAEAEESQEQDVDETEEEELEEQETSEEETQEDEELEEEDSEESEEEDSEDDETELDEEDSDESEGEEEDEEQEGEQESEEELEEDSDDDLEEEEAQDEEDESQQDNEFNIYDFTDGVFESTEDLKKTSQLLKENPELQEMLEFYEKEGTLLPYLQATQIDFDKMDDLEVLRQDYFEENSEYGLTASELEDMFREDVLSKYSFDDEDEKKAKIAKIRFKKDANSKRAKFKEQQAKLKLPIERDAIQEIEKAEKLKAEKLESERNKLGYQIRKEVKDGKLKVNVDGKNFADLKVSPKKLTSLLSDLQAIDIFKDEKGNFDLRRMAMVANPDAFISSISETYKSEGKKEFITKDLKNRKPKGKKKVGVQKEEPKNLNPFNLTKEQLKKVKVKRFTK